MKKSKLLKSLGFASLAVFMGATALFSFAPLNNTSIVAGGLNASAHTENQTFDLGLRPDTDPVVYVTESGLEIKKSNGKYTSTTTTTTNTGYTYTQDLTSFYYFTMGTFSGTIYTAKTQTDKYEVSNEPVNWLIIGRGQFDFYDETVAGNSIKNDSSKQEFAVTNNLYLPLAMQAIPENDDIPDNCFLVLSEKLLGSMYFNSGGALNGNLYTDDPACRMIYGANGMWGNRYRYIGDRSVLASANGSQSWTNKAEGSLYTYINNLFSKNTSGTILKNGLGFTQIQSDMIVPQQLYTYYSNGSSYSYAETPKTDGGTYYSMFPLAYRATSSSIFQNFCVEDYISTNAQRIATFIGSSSNQSYHWHLRSGMNGTATHVHRVLYSGDIGVGVSGSHDTNGVRPAFVMRIIE